MDWNDGYVADIAYPTGFFPEQGPAHLAITCILNGIEPPPACASDRPFTYFELGAGTGMTATVLAATHPHGQFFANDFQPAHVCAARALAEDAGLANLTMVEHGFADLAEGALDLPPLDYVTLSGVYSWVSPENRRHVVDFIARYLKPGGVVYVNYNAMPGWSGGLALQRLMLEYSDRHPGPRARQVAQLRSFVAALADSGAGYFDAGPALRKRLRSVAQDKAGYLAHEYLGRHWEALYHADVARAMAGARLDHVGSASLARAWPGQFLEAGQRAVLDAIDDPLLRETVSDYLHDTCFREDVLVRGARPLGAHRRDAWLARLGLARLAATLPADAVALPAGIDPGQAESLQAPLRTLLEALAEVPMLALNDLLALPAFEGMTLDAVARLGALLASSGQAAFRFLPTGAVDRAPSLRLNRALARRALDSDDFQGLAAPQLASGVQSGLVQRLVYHALCTKPDLDSSGILSEVDLLLDRHAAAAGETGSPAFARLRAELPHTVGAILRLRVPLWRAQGVL